MNELTQRGINALRSGDKATARSLLSAAIQQDPNDLNAWLWLSGAVEGNKERIQCLQQVLRIDPGNAAAARGLAKTMEKRPPTETAAASPETPAPAAEAQPAQVVVEPVQAGPVLVTDTTAPEAAPLAPEPIAQPAEQLATEPASEVPAPAAEQPKAREAGRRKRSKAVQEGAQLIFRTRPSVVMALIGFWVFLAGAAGIGYLLRKDLVMVLIFGVGLGLILEGLVLYAAIRNLAARYELTSQQLTVRFRGKRTRVPVEDIYHAEYKQTFFQRVVGTGDVLVEAVVNGELARLRMRNIAECKRRVDQIQSMINEDLAPARSG